MKKFLRITFVVLMALGLVATYMFIGGGPAPAVQHQANTESTAGQ